MSTSVVKILVHGADIVSGAIMPVGQFSEEAQESINKDRKYFRRIHSRKISRSSKKDDVFNLLLVSSGPLISSLRRSPKKATKTYFPEALQLFAGPKESENLGSFGTTTTEVDSYDTSEEISN
jgi:hypothetical protein